MVTPTRHLPTHVLVLALGLLPTTGCSGLSFTGQRTVSSSTPAAQSCIGQPGVIQYCGMPYCSKPFPVQPPSACYSRGAHYCAKPLPDEPRTTCHTHCDDYLIKPLPFTDYPTSICGCVQPNLQHASANDGRKKTSNCDELVTP